MTRSDSAIATQGRIKPSAFSSLLRPGHSIVYRTRPALMWHMQVRHVPLRHDLGKRKPSKLAASRMVSDSGASKVRPDGSTRTAKTRQAGTGEEFSDIFPEVRGEARGRFQSRLRKQHT